MAVLGIIDVHGFTTEQYDAVVDHMGVEGHALGSIYLHLAAQTADGLRIVEIWDDKDEFEKFIDTTLFPAMAALNPDQTHTVTVLPLHNVFTPRLTELPGLSRHAQPGQSIA
ncbi:hypothetical protein ACIRRA_23170 [Nocardia sp. NPDC101769]|uniref:hypothetical protein n=1 Tax=Nocardia sp. NPDC101769 TaxID=3364333 RepID=UPI003806387F